MYAAPASTLVWRGLRKRCGRCGSRHLFTRYFRLRERCPRCGYKFAREEGFFTGVYLVNYGFTALVLVAEIMIWLGVVIANDANDGHSVSMVPALVLGVVTAIVLPIALYPWAATTWAAVDLAMRPLDPVEEAEAAVHAESPDQLS